MFKPSHPRLARALWQSLLVGLWLLAFVPAARGDSPIGPLPLWLLAAPLSALIAAYCTPRA